MRVGDLFLDVQIHRFTWFKAILLVTFIAPIFLVTISTLSLHGTEQRVDRDHIHDRHVADSGVERAADRGKMIGICGIEGLKHEPSSGMS